MGGFSMETALLRIRFPEAAGRVPSFRKAPFGPAPRASSSMDSESGHCGPGYLRWIFRPGLILFSHEKEKI